MVLFFWRAGPDPFSPFRLPQSEKIAVPKVSYGLMAVGSDICVQELSRKALGQRYLPATASVSVSYSTLLLAVSDMGWLSILSLVDVLFHALSLFRSMSNSLEATHDYRVVLLVFGTLRFSPPGTPDKNSPSFPRKHCDP